MLILKQYSCCVYKNMIKSIKLKELADIIGGFTFREALNFQTSGNVSVLQAGDLSDKITIKSEDLSIISYHAPRTDAILKNNDLVISVKGTFKAGLFEKQGNRTAIASSSVNILRLKQRNILPEFLAVYLNSDLARRKFKKISTGAAIPVILKKDLENLEIPIIDLKKQETIVKLYRNNQKQQIILKQEQVLKNKITQSSIQKLLQN